MYSQFSMLATPITEQIEGFKNFHKTLVIGNWLLVVSLTVLVCSIAISFFFEQHFSMFVQVIAHLATIIFAGVLKVGYVLRCVALKGLGERV